MPVGASLPDPFVLDDSFQNISTAPNNMMYRQTAGLTPKAQAFNSALKNLVLIGAGQSNATTLLPTLYNPPSAAAIDNFNIYDGASYPVGGGPMVGCQWLPQNGSGNLLLRLAQKLITRGWDRIIVVPIALGASVSAQWATGNLAGRIPVALRRLASRGYTVGATGLSFCILFMQGESDTGTPQATYQANIGTILTTAQSEGFIGSACRFFMPKETWLAGAVNPTVQAAQVAVRNGTTIFDGGDLDTINATGRQAENTHFNDTGADTAATLIEAAMHASGAPY